MDYTSISRRTMLQTLGLGAAATLLRPANALAHCGSCAGDVKATQPNIIQMMADDMGWGDVGYNGHPMIKTPNLDTMAKEGVRFDRFYSAAPVCSPTRGSAITGRHPYRYGIPFANTGHMKKEEITLADALKPMGYTTGHFGKWHLGTLTTKIEDANRGKLGSTKNFSPPWVNGFDVCFSSESKVPTWDPTRVPAKFTNGSRHKGWNALKDGDKTEHYGTHYFTGQDQVVADKDLKGCDSKLIMDHALKFIASAAKKKQPFFTICWFHAPHLPVVAGPKYFAMYPKAKNDFRRNYYGCVTAIDDQVGRLRKELATLGVADNTMIFNCSDNGPEGENSSPGRAQRIVDGKNIQLKGRKRMLEEGGVRVPGLMVWPAKLKTPTVVTTPCSTSDFFPTVVAALGHTLKDVDKRPYDGEDLLPIIAGKKTTHAPIGFQSAGKSALIDNDWKIIKAKDKKSKKAKGEAKTNAAKPKAKWELYNIVKDPGETKNIVRRNPERAKAMIKTFTDFQASCARSNNGEDYTK